MTAGKVFDLYMFIIICSVLTGLSAASDLTLTFKDSVLITDTAFFLDDIAEIECNDNTLKAKR